MRVRPKHIVGNSFENIMAKSDESKSVVSGKGPRTVALYSSHLRKFWVVRLTKNRQENVKNALPGAVLLTTRQI